MDTNENTSKTGRSKKRNAEKRKEKSRDAARTRRSKEADVFAELSALIPFPTATVAALDKTSMMRLCISYLKLRSLGNGIKENLDTSLDEKIQQQYLKSMNGFLVVMDKNGDMIFVSDNIMQHLGLAQIDIVGQNIYDYSHPCDHDEIHDVLDAKLHGSDADKDEEAKKETTFFARLKCTLTSKGRNVNLKSATFKVIRFQGHQLRDTNPECWVLIGESIPHPSHVDVPLDSYSFLTRHNMDMKFSYCDERAEDLLGYDQEDLMHHPLYEFHHAGDGEYMDKIYKTLFSKGQVWTDSYRFLASGGGYAWVQSQATVVYNNKTEKPQFVLCIHYMISGIEEPETILSSIQLKTSHKKNNVKPMVQVPSVKSPSKRIVTAPVMPLQPVQNGPILSTESIFTPRTKCMEKGVCSPKRKISDATDLELGLIAPNAGEIIPLSLDTPDNEMVQLLQDMLTGADVDVGMLNIKKENVTNNTTTSQRQINQQYCGNKKIDISSHYVDIDGKVSSLSSTLGTHRPPATVYVTLETLPSGKKQLKPCQYMPLATVPPAALHTVLPSSTTASDIIKHNDYHSNKKSFRHRGSVSSGSYSSSSSCSSNATNNSTTSSEDMDSSDSVDEEDRVHNWLETLQAAGANDNIMVTLQSASDKNIFDAHRSCSNNNNVRRKTKNVGGIDNKTGRGLKKRSNAKTLKKPKYATKIVTERSKAGNVKGKNENELCSVLNKLLVGEAMDDTICPKVRTCDKNGNLITKELDIEQEKCGFLPRTGCDTVNINNTNGNNFTKGMVAKAECKKKRTVSETIIHNLLVKDKAASAVKSPCSIHKDNNVTGNKDINTAVMNIQSVYDLLCEKSCSESSESDELDITLEENLLEENEITDDIFCSGANVENSNTVVDDDDTDFIMDYDEKQLSDMIDENLLFSIETCSSPIDPPLNDDMFFNLGITASSEQGQQQHENEANCIDSEKTFGSDECCDNASIPFLTENDTQSKPVTKEAYLNVQEDSLKNIKDVKVNRVDNNKVCTEFDLLDEQDDEEKEDTLDSIFHDLPFSFQELMSEEKCNLMSAVDEASDLLNEEQPNDNVSPEELPKEAEEDLFHRLDNLIDVLLKEDDAIEIDAIKQDKYIETNVKCINPDSLSHIPQGTQTPVYKKHPQVRVRKKKKKQPQAKLHPGGAIKNQRKFEVKKNSGLVISIGYSDSRSKKKKELRIPIKEQGVKNGLGQPSGKSMSVKLGSVKTVSVPVKHNRNSVLYQLLTGT